MIDLNPSHEAREPIKPPPEATPEEYHCKWYQITDKVSYLPAGMVTGKVHFKACFHDLPQGLQTHVYAPMGLDIKEKWTLGGNLPGEPVQPVEIGVGAPISGLYLREDVEMKCNFLMTKFVKKTLKDALATLVARLVVKSQLVEAVHQNRRLTYDPTNPATHFTPPLSPPMSPRQTYSPPMSPPPTGGMGMPMDYPPKWAEAHALQQMGGSQRNSYIPPQYSPHPPQQQYSPQFPTQQYYQQMMEQQQMMQQQQGQGQYQNPNQPMFNEMDASHQTEAQAQAQTQTQTQAQAQVQAQTQNQNQKYAGVSYGPAELPS